MQFDLFHLLNNVTIYSLLLTLSFVLRDWKKLRGPNVVLSFVLCIILYLLVDDIKNQTVHFIILSGPFLLPLTFWLFARSLFRDSQILPKNIFLIIPLTLSAYYLLYFLNLFENETSSNLLTSLISICFVILALIESQSGKLHDLDQSRIKLRKQFVILIGAMMLITILVEITLHKTNLDYPRIIQRIFILLLNSLFIISNFTLGNKMLIKRKKIALIKNPKLIEKIQAAIIDKELFKQEKLTISQLSEIIQEKEHKVRKAINQELGYRNFLDFINSYRIKEAITILKDESKSNLTILEIAYQTGFNSIGPFNRAFKLATGSTPTEFRRRHSLS